MKRIRYSLLGLTLCVMLASCTGADEVAEENTQTTFSLLLSVRGTGNVMRQGADVVQAEGQPFRGIQDVGVIPFRTDNNTAVQLSDFSMVSTVSQGVLHPVEGHYYYYMEDCPLLWETNRLLLYGRAVPKAFLRENGSIVSTLFDSPHPENITFRLTSIRNTTDVHNDAQDLADYLTAIAHSATATGEKWSETTESTLKVLYENFIKAGPETNKQMGGSARCVKAYVNVLREQVQHVSGDMSTAILASIDNTAAFNDCLNNGYPSDSQSLGLPDGAAVVRWDGTQFVVSTQTTTLDHVNGIIRYTYPAELWYFVDSPIQTSEAKVSHSTYQNAGEWNNLLTESFTDGGEVTRSTKTIAVQKPLQYGVGCLKTTLATITGTLKDAHQVVVDYGNDPTKLPLRGIVIGGQHTVGFNFKPQGEKSDVDARFIYDSQVGNTNTVNTLVLQSYDGEKVPVALELENKTGHPFAGKDGIVYPDTRFYLIAEIDPAGKGDADYAKRVFTQDYTTTVNMTVTSLANAYTCMPDLLEPRLEIGVELTTKWEQTTPTTVILN